ncbi:MAG: aminopeptidase P N-terminal domain-containing protein [Gemmatimonadota bacterium]|jgi:Xaa-Pro aminopeptidase|nr:aminopeptidase P N-terminal domain-containing protein [Gemmatimonadota bacterium]
MIGPFRYATAGAILLLGVARPLSGQAGFPVDHPAPTAGAIPAQEYLERRAALTDMMAEDGVFIAFGTPTPDPDYLPWSQNANFRYLTGITEPDAGLIIEKKDGQITERLFVQPKNPAREVWDGTRLGVDGAGALTGIPSFSIDEFVPQIDSLVALHTTVYTLAPFLTTRSSSQMLTRDQQQIKNALDHSRAHLASLAEPLRRIRARKSPGELDMIRRAAHISSLAQVEAIRTAAPGINEFEIQALIEYTFRRNGGEHPAFSSIVGSGPNSTALHYRNADRFMAEGELLVMDIGTAYRGYAADVTRTIPVGSTFTPDQREIYSIVLSSQRAAEDAAVTGSSWTDVSAAAASVIAEGLTRLGLIDAPGATYICASARTSNLCPQYELFYMHGVGHGVGLDVHDTDISSFETFQVGSAFTLEPGIYVRTDALDYLSGTPENEAMVARLRPAVDRYHDIGVRIEDTYIITDTGLERLSWAAPREIHEIEEMRREPAGQSRRNADVINWYRDTEEH